MMPTARTDGPIISSHADHRTSDYRFLRSRQDWLYVPLERLPARYSWLDIIEIAVGAVLLGAAIIGCFYLPVFVMAVMKP